jgi:hypothetical protein
MFKGERDTYILQVSIKRIQVLMADSGKESVKDPW